jgi:DNA repair protein RAD50
MNDFQDKKRRQSQSMSIYDSGGRSLDLIEEEQVRRNERKDELQAKKDRLVAEESRFIQKHSQNKVRLAEKERLYTEALQKGNRYNEVEKQQKDLLSKIEQLEDRKRSLLLEKEEVSRQKGDRDNSLKDAKADLKEKTDAVNSKIAGISSVIDSVGRLIENLEGVTARCEKTNLAQITENLDNAQVEIAQKEEIVKTNAPKITAINSDISSRSKFKRVAEDNMEIRQVKKEREKLRAKLKEMQDSRAPTAGMAAGGSGGSAEEQLHRAQRDLQKLEHDRSKLTSEKDRLIGHMEIYEKQSVDLLNKLKTPVYKNIEDRYRIKSIEYETTLMAVTDLTTYYEALDSALQNFHTIKIKEINKIIRELWMLIYKGQDIDTIELESGTESPTSGRTSRSYNYRVVMRKGDTPLDMRGRCSAGQRVLASIVIRLALAETFCLHCGILALDEPTTNLDEPNKTGLAHALSRIIINRKKQQNFQLICITHDEDFVRLMKNELSASPDFAMPESYFRVYREADSELTNKFFSKIERISWDAM